MLKCSPCRGAKCHPHSNFLLGNHKFIDLHGLKLLLIEELAIEFIGVSFIFSFSSLHILFLFADNFLTHAKHVGWIFEFVNNC
jgi:hypothetical protein